MYTKLIFLKMCIPPTSGLFLAFWYDDTKIIFVENECAPPHMPAYAPKYDAVCCHKIYLFHAFVFDFTQEIRRNTHTNPTPNNISVSKCV